MADSKGKPKKANIEAPENNIFIKIEEDILKFWEDNNIYFKARERNLKGKKFYFLDGPPYTSGRAHLGHAWNKSLKDMVLRYKRMQGFNVWGRAGYDMHGMPTEHATEKKLGISGKEEIEKIGIKKFTEECRKLCIENMHSMNKDFKRLGVWMDFDNAYMPITKEYIEGEWWLIKKAHENKRLYEGEKTMHWCAGCGTTLAKHELEYQTIKENSIFLKFPVVGSENEFLIIWTTTPWTIPFNLGVMVNPELEYLKVEVEDKGRKEKWIIAKCLAGAFLGGVCSKRFKILKEYKGEQLEGIKYMHPFYNDIPVYKKLEKVSDRLFTVVLSEEYVNLSAGTGLVHMAPGCGPEDYEVGHRNGIPPFNNLSENGVFPKEMGKFAGLTAKKDDRKFVEALDKVGALIATTDVEHEYAHCWRCKEPVIFRTTKQWFFKVEDLRETMRELNREIYWVPDFAGNRSFDSWLANLRDNGITRQRYWGTPLPVWKCGKCGNYVVVGNVKELEKLAGKGNVPEDLHKPYIDDVLIPCHCGEKMRRIPDILDVWIDAGSCSWNCLDYPHRDDLFKKLYPADFILEGIDQVRGWFNMLFVASMVSMLKPSYKAVYMHGFINDAQGRKMSKSLGNYILPEEVINAYGSETLRYYMTGGTKPGVNINYNFEDMMMKFKNLGILWNLHKFALDLKKANNLEPEKVVLSRLSVEERYIMSRLNSTLRTVTELYDKYFLNEVPWKIEELYLELSRTYIKSVRDKAAIGSKEEKQMVLDVMAEVLNKILIMFAPICPMVTEQIYLNLKNELDLKEESIHFHKWPKVEEKYIDEDLERSFETAKDIMQAVLNAREKAQLGIRWPLKDLIIATKDEEARSTISNLGGMIMAQANVKKIFVHEGFDKAKVKVRPNYKTIGKKYSKDVPKIIAHIAKENDAAILKKLKDGVYKFKVDKQEFELTSEDFTTETFVPKEYVMAEFRKGKIYIDTTRTAELDAEGYNREIMRRIQMLRKTALLEKKDEIKLCISLPKSIIRGIKQFEDEIKAKCGAKELCICETVEKECSCAECRNYKHKEKFKVKEQEVSIMLEVVLN